MTNFNKALIAAASSIALFAGATAFVAPEAKAYTTCTHNDFIGTTNCYGSGGGSFNSTYNDFTGTSTYSGRDRNGNYYSGSCTHNDFIGTTTCY